jgi:hypothetical protein
VDEVIPKAANSRMQSCKNVAISKNMAVGEVTRKMLTVHYFSQCFN